jgi:hypothetical protein
MLGAVAGLLKIERDASKQLAPLVFGATWNRTHDGTSLAGPKGVFGQLP